MDKIQLSDRLNEASFHVPGGTIKITLRNGRLLVRGLHEHGPECLDAITVLPHSDNSITLKLRTRQEAGLPPLDSE